MVELLLLQIKEILIGFDQFINTLLGGHADETFSARTYRLRENNWWWVAYVIINHIFFWQEDHCKGSYMAEIERKHLPDEYKNK